MEGLQECFRDERGQLHRDDAEVTCEDKDYLRVRMICIPFDCLGGIDL